MSRDYEDENNYSEDLRNDGIIEGERRERRGTEDRRRSEEYRTSEGRRRSEEYRTSESRRQSEEYRNTEGHRTSGDRRRAEEHRRSSGKRPEGRRTESRAHQSRNHAQKSGLSAIPVWVHALLIAIIVGVIAFSGYKLARWNMGTAETEGVVEGDFEVEVLDQVFLLPPDKKALHEDDGVETILFLGNNILTYYNDENGFVEQVAKKTGATCLNAGFTDSTVAQKNAQYDPSYSLDAFSFYNISQCIKNDDFSVMHSAAKNFGDSTYDDHTNVLDELDMNTVDTLAIFYDAQDYISLRYGMNPNDEHDPITYRGALNAGIKAIQEKYPFIRIVCLSFPMCYAYNTDGSLVSGDRFDFGNGRLTTYLQFMIDVSGETGVTFIDNYYGTIDEENSSGWLLDNIHVNAACNEYMADHFSRVVYGNE